MPDLQNTLSVGELVANSYRIVGMAGAGGMGIVYRARDTRLERTVALKFLPQDLNASDREKERFLREARTASSLDHPNIGVIHGIEETPDGRTFIVMAFYEGQSLAQRIRANPIPLSEALDIAVQMTRGLAEAHSRQIVHRDIKPSNVMLTASGAVKIVDFGLAHVVSTQTMTETGVTGTIAYMSPEQTLGHMVDPRSDIWSLGLVLAEMLTGRNPMERDTISATVVAILNEPPRQLDGVPMELQHIVYRALSKDPQTRYQTCQEVLADLESVRALGLEGTPGVAGDGAALPASKRTQRLAELRRSEVRKSMQNAARSTWPGTVPPTVSWMTWLAGPIAVVVTLGALLLFPPVRERLQAALFSSGEKHIAVLPFDNIGDNPENDALVIGLMDSLSGKLSNLDVGKKSLWVVPTSEVRRLKVTDPSAALKDLGANLVVKGSVERDGKDVHLQVNLIDTKSMRQIGSADVEDAAGDLATLQNEAVARLARLMNITVTADMLRNTGGSVNPAAYEDYLTALGYTQRFDKPGNLGLAIADLQKSIQTDPRFALGYAQLGEVYRLKYTVEQNPKWLDEALAYCQKAAELDNRVPAVFVTLAQIHDLQGKHDLALQEFQHALDLDPKDAAALGGLARSYENSGRIAEAEKTFEKAAVMRPDDWYGYNELGAFYDRQGKYPQAIAAYRQALQITPDNSEIYSNMAAAYLDAGDPQSLVHAEQALKKSVELNPSYPAYANLGLLYMQEKRYAEAAAATEKALQINGNNYLVWNNLALAYDGSGQTAKADAARQRTQQLAEQVVTVKPQDAMAQSTLAIVYAHDKLDEKARAKIQTSLALAPEDPNVLSNVGEAYELMGDRAQALKYIEKSLQKGYAFDQIANEPALQSLIADPRFKKAGK